MTVLSRAGVFGLLLVSTAVGLWLLWCAAAGLRTAVEGAVRWCGSWMLRRRVVRRRVPLLAVDGAGSWSFAQECGM